jgi:hypothetical protein
MLYRRHMTTHTVRVWVPDRPGALGAVASRIGAVGGDLVGIDILERGGGRAIDELVVELPDDALVPLLISEVSEVDGVDVEDVRQATAGLVDARLDALETAAVLVEQDTIDSLLDALSVHANHDFEAEWAVVVGLGAEEPAAAVGTPPPGAWLAAFVTGSRASVVAGNGEAGPDDVAWAGLAAADLALVVGRRGRPFRARERRQLTALARIANHRWSELAGRTARAPGVAAR